MMPEAAGFAFDVLAVGEILLDFVAPDADALAGATTFVRAAGGAPANVVVAAARAGARSGFIGAVGADPFGAYLEEVLATNGVDVALLQTVPERTTLAFVAKNRGGIPDFVFYRGSDTTLSPEHLPAEALSRSRFVHVSSMALMTEPSRSATLQATDLAHAGMGLVSVDPNLRPSSWPSLAVAFASIAPLLEVADILKINDEEARLFSGTDDLDSALQRLGGERCLVVITRGDRGCMWRWKDRTGSVAAPSVQVVDTTGAGDAFVGALLGRLSALGYSATNIDALTVEDLENALRFAAAAGAFACTKTGAMPSLPTRDEIERLLRHE